VSPSAGPDPSRAARINSGSRRSEGRERVPTRSCPVAGRQSSIPTRRSGRISADVLRSRDVRCRSLADAHMASAPPGSAPFAAAGGPASSRPDASAAAHGLHTRSTPVKREQGCEVGRPTRLADRVSLGRTANDSAVIAPKSTRDHHEWCVRPRSRHPGASASTGAQSSGGFSQRFPG
jgi:hypothetical protein